jgi:hypothetical protein
MKADETYLDEFGEAIVWSDDDLQAAIETPLREDDEDGFRERLDDPKYDADITEAVRAEEVRILDEELAEDSETR